MGIGCTTRKLDRSYIAQKRQHIWLSALQKGDVIWRALFGEVAFLALHFFKIRLVCGRILFRRAESLGGLC